MTADGEQIKSFTLRRDRQATEAAGDAEAQIPFMLDGEKYTLYPERVNSLVVMDLGNMEIAQNSEPMWELLEGLLGPDYRRFRRHLRGPSFKVDAKDFAELIGWMLEQVAEVPTERSPL